MLCLSLESPLRKVLIPLPALYIVVSLGLSVEAVWYCVAAANVVMTFVTVGYARSVLGRIGQPAEG